MRAEDEFQVAENRTPDLVNKKIGERLRGIINYEVIEKTKSYTMIRVRFMSVIQTKRAF